MVAFGIVGNSHREQYIIKFDYNFECTQCLKLTFTFHLAVFLMKKLILENDLGHNTYISDFTPTSSQITYIFFRKYIRNRKLYKSRSINFNIL